jgi:1-aminocyclopropane-1-carboxylate synthase
MEAAVVKAAEEGIQAKVLLVTNPGNPLGTLYPESTLKVNSSRVI